MYVIQTRLNPILKRIGPDQKFSLFVKDTLDKIVRYDAIAIAYKNPGHGSPRLTIKSLISSCISRSSLNKTIV